MENIIKVPIQHEESFEVEKLFYEYNALLDILAYLNNNSTNEAFIDRKLDKATELFIALEKAKEKYSNKYKPQDCNIAGYTFDFDERAIIYNV